MRVKDSSAEKIVQGWGHLVYSVLPVEPLFPFPLMIGLFFCLNFPCVSDVAPMLVDNVKEEMVNL